MREREREREIQTEREREIDGSDVTIVALKLAMNLLLLLLLADPWRYAAISIECVACNCGDLFNDRGISKKPEKHA